MAITRQPRAWEHQLALAREHSAETPQFGTWTAPSVWFPATSKIKYNPNRGPVDLPLGSPYQRLTTTGKIEVAGSLALPLCPGRCADFVKMVALADVTHLWSFSVLERHSPEFAKAHVGVTANTIRITHEKPQQGPDRGLRAAIDVIGKNTTTDKGVGTPNYDDQPLPFVWADLTLEVDSVDVTAMLRRIELSFGFNLDSSNVGADLMVRDLPIGEIEVGLTADLDWENIAWRDRLMAGTEIPVVATWDNGANDLIATYPRCQVFQGTDPEQLEDKGQGNQVQPEIRALEGDDGTVPYTLTAS